MDSRTEDGQIGGSDVERRQSKVLTERIRERMTALGTNARQTSLKAGRGATLISEILSGANNNPSNQVLLAIASALDCSVAYLLGETDIVSTEPEQRGTISVPVIGIAEAGAFRHMSALNYDDSSLPMREVQLSRRFPRARHFALQIRGDSMNASRTGPLTDGMFVMCVDMKSADLEFENDRLYAVRRSLDRGRTFETSIKRATVFRDRIELASESTRQHDKFIISRSPSSDSEPQVEAFGLVYAALLDFE